VAEALVLHHGFEPQISISLATERSAIAVITISYDREVAGEDVKAWRCYCDLTDALIARGYPPYRLNVAAMELAAGDATYSAMLSRLRVALDPGGVLAPGRYIDDGDEDRSIRVDVA
jgi:4-cresol dehydrogenase (hydroxylating)